MRTWVTLSLLVYASCIPSVVSAQISFNETADVDLGDPIEGSPTILGSLGIGVNTVSGSLDNTFTFLDRDAFQFTVADGLQLDNLSFTLLEGDNRFYALSNQDAALSTTSAGGNYYISLIGASSVGVNLLDGTLNSLGPPGSGGSGPLAAGDYTFWIQETDFTVANYSLSLTTSAAVPEPGSVFVLLCSGGLMCIRRRRTTDSHGLTTARNVADFEIHRAAASVSMNSTKHH